MQLMIIWRMIKLLGSKLKDKKRKEIEEIWEIAKEIDEIKDMEYEEILDIRNDLPEGFPENYFTRQLVDLIERERLHGKDKENSVDLVMESIKALEKRVAKLEKRFELTTEEIMEKLENIEQMVAQRDNIDNEEVIEIKEYSYTEARELILNYFKMENREIFPSEFLYKFGIDLELVHKILSDLVREGKIE